MAARNEYGHDVPLVPGYLKRNPLKRKNSFVPFGIATAALVALAAGAMFYSNTHAGVSQVRSTERPLSGPEPILPESLPTPAASPSAGSATTAFVYQVASDDNGSHLKKVSVSLGLSGDASGDPAPLAALNAMAAESDSPLPSGTHAESYTVSDGVATVDFNQAFVDHFHGGRRR